MSFGIFVYFGFIIIQLCKLYAAHACNPTDAPFMWKLSPYNGFWKVH